MQLQKGGNIVGYTNFAKFIRKLMIDHDQNLGILAKELDVSAAFVSSVFTGKKPIPETWLDKIIKLYNLNKRKQEELLKAYSESKESIKLDLSMLNQRKKELAIQFQRKFENLSKDDISKLEKILKESEE